MIWLIRQYLYIWTRSFYHIWIKPNFWCFLIRQWIHPRLNFFFHFFMFNKFFQYHESIHLNIIGCEQPNEILSVKKFSVKVFTILSTTKHVAFIVFSLFATFHVLSYSSRRNKARETFLSIEWINRMNGENETWFV